MSATEIEDYVRWVLSNAREDDRRKVDRSALALAISVIEAERVRADDAREKLRALVEAVEERERRGWLCLPALESALAAARGAL